MEEDKKGSVLPPDEHFGFSATLPSLSYPPDDDHSNTNNNHNNNNATFASSHSDTTTTSHVSPLGQLLQLGGSLLALGDGLLVVLGPRLAYARPACPYPFQLRLEPLRHLGLNGVRRRGRTHLWHALHVRPLVMLTPTTVSFQELNFPAATSATNKNQHMHLCACPFYTARFVPVRGCVVYFVDLVASSRVDEKKSKREGKR